MSKINTVLFDFDGVIANTEPLYDEFFEVVGKKHNLPEDFVSKIKGVTFPYIMKNFFANASEDVIKEVTDDTKKLELEMPYEPIKGVIEFIKLVRKKGYKVGLVTSSRAFKVEVAMKKMNLFGLFDTIVTADSITESKPDPMCYLLGAKNLNSDPSECIVFEDALLGVQAATTAGMRVIGISSTVPVEKLEKKVYRVFPDFLDEKAILECFE